MEQVKIDTEFVTLGQLLKMTDIISSGGMSKWFLEEHTVHVNGEEENRRGKKLRNGDIVDIQDFGKFQVNSSQDGPTDVY